MAPGWGMVPKRCAGEILLAGRMSQPSVGLFENLLGARGTTAGHTEFSGLQKRVEIADATGSLHLHARRGVLPHQGQILHRSAAAAEASGRLDPVDTQITAHLAETDLLRVIEVAVLEDHFDLLPRGVRDVGDSPDVGANRVPVATEYLRDVDNHVQFLAAILESLHRFGRLGARCADSVRKANRRAGPDSRSGQDFSTPLEPERHDANAGHIVRECQSAACLQISLREGHGEEGVVDHLGNVQVGVGWRGRMSHSRALGSNGATVWEVEDLAQSS